MALADRLVFALFRKMAGAVDLLAVEICGACEDRSLFHEDKEEEEDEEEDELDDSAPFEFEPDDG